MACLRENTAAMPALQTATAPRNARTGMFRLHANHRYRTASEDVILPAARQRSSRTMSAFSFSAGWRSARQERMESEKER